jgi:soluble lytic murein transglycosylase-like protein
MAFPIALLPIIAQLAPLAARLIGNAVDGKAGAEVGETIAREVTGAATRVFGTADAGQVQAAIAADPNKAAEFKLEMEKLATQAQLANLSADLENVKSARAALSSDSWLVRNAPGILSVIITIGFFGTLLSLILGWGAGLQSANQTVREVLALLLGALTLAFGDVRNFWLGSSAGSKKKDEALADSAQRAIQNQADQTRFVVQQIAAPAARRSAEQQPPAAVAPTPPVTPAAQGFRKAFPGGVGWRTTPEGVIVEGETEPVGTIGAPNTVRRIWNDFGPIILKCAVDIGVPAELIVATIATESRGNKDATRTEPDGRQSVGLMQTLLGTASEVMERPVTADELRDPETSITAGAKYIRKQRARTEFEPPLVAAAYNAGSLRETDKNRWKLVSTDEHVDRFCKFYNDAVRVAKEDRWFG